MNTQEVIRGTILKKMEPQRVSEKFIKQEIIIECGDKYPAPIKFEIQQDNVEKFKEFKVGQVVHNVKYNLKGREWTKPDGIVVYFNTLVIWSMSATEQTQPHHVTSHEHWTGLKGDIAQDSIDSQIGPEDLPF